MASDPRIAIVSARAAVGGALMGLANLVPGVSGGTMLLAAGVYPQCIAALAKLSRLRPDRKSLVVLASVALPSALIILLLAGTVKSLVVEHRWAMYSLFLGSTLGGVPTLWTLLGRPNLRAWLGCATGLAAMVATVFVPASPGASATAQPLALFLAGLGAFAAMLLPGLSGGYLLVLSGQYVPILGAVDGLKESVLGSDSARWQAMLDSVQVLAPFAAGGIAALAGVSTLVGILLQRQRSLTLGFLLGLLAGAVLGLWPFESDGFRLILPGPARAMFALGLAACGFLVTSGVARLGASDSGT